MNRLHDNCPTCTCGHRVPVQAEPKLKKGPGTVDWSEHKMAHTAYAAKYGAHQSAEMIAQRGGFSYGELVMFLEHEPETWVPA